MAIQHVYTNAVPDGTATSVVRPSDWNSSHFQAVNLGGNVAGAGQVTGLDVTLVGGNNVTLSADVANSQVVFSIPNFGAANLSGIAASNGTLTAGTVLFSNQNGLTFGTAAPNAITGSFSTLAFANSNGVSFGVNAGTLTATVKTNYLTTARASNDGLGTNTAQSNVTWTANSSGLSLDARGYAGTGTTTAGSNVGITLTHDSRGINLSITAPNPVGGQFSAGVTNSGNSAGSTGITGSQLAFVGGANITLSQATGANGGTISVIGGSGSFAAGASNLGNTAGSTGTVSNQIVLVGSNAISLSQSTGTGGATITILDPGTSSIVGGANVTISSAGSTISIIAAGGTAPPGAAISAGTQSVNSGTLVFSNSNGISFGMSGSSRITASYTVPATVGLISAINVSAGTLSNNLTNLVFSNGGNVSFGLNGATITASAAGGTGGGGGIALANSQTTYTSGTAVLSEGGGAITIASSAGQQFKISVPATSQLTAGANITISTAGSTISIIGGAGGGGVAIAGGTQTATSGTVNFANSNGITFGMSGSNQITASYNSTQFLTTARASTDAIGLNTAQSNVTWTVNSSGLSFDARGYAGTATSFGGTNVSGSMTHNSQGLTISLSAPAVGGAQTGISSLIAGQTQTIGALSFSNANGVSFGIASGANTGTLTASIASTYAGTGFTTTATAGTAVVATHDSNGLKLGVPAYITTYVAQTQQPMAFSAGGGSSTANTLSFSNSFGVSFSNSNGSVVGSIATTYAGTGFTSTTTAGTNIAATLNTSGLSMAVPAFLTAAAGGGVAIAASNTTFTSGTVVMSNNGGALTIGSGAQSVLFSVPATSSLVGVNGISVSSNASTISVSNQGLAVSGGAGTSTSLTGITFANSNGITFGLSTGANVGTMTASYNSTQFVGQGTTITGNASITLGSAGMSFNGSNLAGTGTAATGSISMTLGSAGLSLNLTNLAGTRTNITGGALITLNSSGLSFNGTSLAGTGTSVASTTGNYSLALNSTGLTVSVPYFTRYIWPPYAHLTQITAPVNASQSIQYVMVPAPITATRLDALMAMSHSSSAGAGTVTIQFSQYAIIYTKNASTLSSLSSGSTQTTYSYASNTAGATYLSQSAIYPMSVPININMAPGEYYVGFNIVSATTAASATLSMMGGNDMQSALNYAEFASTNTSTNFIGGMGLYSAATTGVVTRVSLSAINQTGANLSAANIALIFRNG